MNRPYADEAPMRRVGPLLILLLAAIALILAAVAGLSHLWGVEGDDGPSAGQMQRTAPALETAPQPALQDYLAQKQRTAESYSWIDPGQHLARIPVDEAMRALAAHSELPPGQQAAYLMGAGTKAEHNTGKSVPAQDVTGEPLQRAAGPPASANTPAHSETTPQFRQNLGENLPLHAAFVDTRGRERLLGDYFGRTPVIMVFGYYHCPRLCSTLMDGVLQGVQNAGLPYTLVGIGIDPRETAAAAARKLAAYQAADQSANALHLLTGKQDQIAALAHAAGFQYAYDKSSDQYSHPAGFLIATPDGRISRYFSGLRFDRRDMRLALIEASNEHIGSLAEQVLLLCSHYDPLAGRYTLTVMTVVRAFGLLTIALLAAGLWLAHRRTHAQSRGQSHAGRSS